MSMKMLTILQFSGAFCAFLFVALALPAFVFRGKFARERLSVRLLAYFTIGCFYVINLVFVLQLLHISNRVTLILFTVVPALFTEAKLQKRNPLQLFRQKAADMRKVVEGKLGVRSFLSKILRTAWEKIADAFLRCVKKIGPWIPDMLLFAGLTALVLWMYGTNLVTNFGYGASDVPVHNYWINYMSRGQLFVSGVYPFGFHCVIYYLHAVFGFDTYVLLRVFCLVQTLMIHYALLLFLKLVCRSKYIPYIGACGYAALNIFSSATYWRFFSTLPQEFGMIFILPSIAFLILFFREKKEELEEKKEKPEETEEGLKKKKKARGRSDCALLFFALSFSMTLSGHFYDTMIAGIFCLGIACGYCFRLFTPKYFGRVMLAGIVSIVLAIWPMAIAVVTGTPLEGSLRWGMSIVQGTEESSTDTTQTPEETQTETGTGDVAEDAEAGAAGSDGIPQSSGTTAQQPVKESLKERVSALLQRISACVQTYTYANQSELCVRALALCCILLVLLAAIFMMLRRPDRGAVCLFAAVSAVLLVAMMAAGLFGLPELMQPERTGIFLAYFTPVVVCLCLDSVLSLLLLRTRRGVWLDLASLLCVAAAVWGAYACRLYREPEEHSGIEKNGAVTCLTNIIRENTDFQWTIVSANDELRMAEDRGWHYEISDFLRGMEYSGKNGDVKIPTKKVYFFIEKIPGDYGETYEDSGQSVSEEGAREQLPVGTDLSIYKGKNRWIMMSRIYEWAEKFEELFPNELKVYYEDEEFVCYLIEQNEFRVYNFAIDYGYNVRKTTADEE